MKHFKQTLILSLQPTVPSAGKGTCGTAGFAARVCESAGADLKDHGRGSEESQNVRS